MRAQRARYGGRPCQFCGVLVDQGDRIGRLADGTWGHSLCSAEERRRAAVLSGATYAAQAPSGYRRGRSPSANRSRLR